MENSKNFSSSNTKFLAIFASPNRCCTENSRWVPLMAGNCRKFEKHLDSISFSLFSLFFFYKHLIKLFPLRLILPKQDKKKDSQLIEQVCGLR